MFGDNAFLNTLYLAMPFTNVGVCICVECAFGMLIQRWGILRKPMPLNLSNVRIVGIVNAFTCLHSFCIGEVEARKVLQVYSQDNHHIMHNHGEHVKLTFFCDNDKSLHHGEHIDDVPE